MTEPASRDGLRLAWLWYGCGGLMLLGVAILSLWPALPDVGVGDKTAHLVTYALLGGWFGLLVGHRSGLPLVFVGLLAFSGLIELLQGMTGYRYAEWGDLLANGTGLALGMVLYLTPLRGLLRWVDGSLARAFHRL